MALLLSFACINDVKMTGKTVIIVIVNNNELVGMFRRREELQNQKGNYQITSEMKKMSLACYYGKFDCEH